jgi:hypothetical protein
VRHLKGEPELLQPKPTGATARTEMFLVGPQRDRWFMIRANRMIGVREKVHINPTDPSRAELDVTGTGSRMGD